MTYFYRTIALAIVAFSWSSLQAYTPQTQYGEEITNIDDGVPLDPEIEGSTVPKKFYDCYVEGNKTYFPCKDVFIPQPASCPNAQNQAACTGNDVDVPPNVQKAEISVREVVDSKHPAPKGAEIIGGYYKPYRCYTTKPCEWNANRAICLANASLEKSNGPQYLAMNLKLTDACKISFAQIDID